MSNINNNDQNHLPLYRKRRIEETETTNKRHRSDSYKPFQDSPATARRNYRPPLNIHKSPQEVVSPYGSEKRYSAPLNIHKSPQEVVSSYGSEKRYSANERLKNLRRNLHLSKTSQSQSNNNGSTSSGSNEGLHCFNASFRDIETVTARPSSLEERLGMFGIHQKKNSVSKNASHLTSLRSPKSAAVTPESVTMTNNAMVESVTESDDFMDWSYLEEKHVLSKINEIRIEDFITRVTPSSMFQETLSKELTDMSNNNTILKDIYIVVDTNIFISHLDVIRNVIDTKINGVASPIILIPWMVIQELDFLKDCKKENKLREKCQKAIRFINNKLLVKDSQFKGQSVRDAAQQNFTSKNADDSILHCCLQVEEKQNRAMLLSNDVNLRNKAMLNNIAAYSHTEIMAALDPYKDFGNNSIKGKHIELFFSNLFSFIIFNHFKDSYGIAASPRMGVDIKALPWTLPKCLHYFNRFWRPIFSMFLPKQFIEKVREYSDFLNKHQNIDSMEPLTLKAFIEYGLSICVYLKNVASPYECYIFDCIKNVENTIKTMSLPDNFMTIEGLVVRNI